MDKGSELTCGKPLICRKPAVMKKDHTILCSTGFIITGNTLNRRTERGGIIHYVGISPLNPQKIEMPPSANVRGDLCFDLSLCQIKLGPPLGRSQFLLLI